MSLYKLWTNSVLMNIFNTDTNHIHGYLFKHVSSNIQQYDVHVSIY